MSFWAPLSDVGASTILWKLPIKVPLWLQKKIGFTPAFWIYLTFLLTCGKIVYFKFGWTKLNFCDIEKKISRKHFQNIF